MLSDVSRGVMSFSFTPRLSHLVIVNPLYCLGLCSYQHRILYGLGYFTNFSSASWCISLTFDLANSTLQTLHKLLYSPYSLSFPHFPTCLSQVLKQVQMSFELSSPVNGLSHPKSFFQSYCNFSSDEAPYPVSSSCKTSERNPESRGGCLEHAAHHGGTEC